MVDYGGPFHLEAELIVEYISFVCKFCRVERSGIFPIFVVFRHQHFNCLYLYNKQLMFAYVHEGVLFSVFVCVFIHVCMSTREHWGVLSDYTKPPSGLARTVSCSQQLAAKVSHGEEEEEKKISTSDCVVQCQLDDNMLTLACWNHEIKAWPWPRHPFHPCTTTANWPWWLFL